MASPLIRPLQYLLSAQQQGDRQASQTAFTFEKGVDRLELYMGERRLETHRGSLGLVMQEEIDPRGGALLKRQPFLPYPSTERPLKKRALPKKCSNYQLLLVPGEGIEPSHGQAIRDFKSLASTRSATQAGVPAKDERPWETGPAGAPRGSNPSGSDRKKSRKLQLSGGRQGWCKSRDGIRRSGAFGPPPPDRRPAYAPGE